MQPQLFGVNSHGVFSVDKDNGQVRLSYYDSLASQPYFSKCLKRRG